MKVPEDTRWVKCCRGRNSNCPEVALRGNDVLIRDDDGHVVTMTREQFKDVIRAAAAEASRQSINL
jgi:hypothetical protein